MSPFNQPMRLFFIIALLAAAPAAAWGAQAAGGDGKSRITAASGVRVRSEPAADADEVARLRVGVVVRELGRSAERQRVGGVEDFWFRVATPDGKEGWVFGALTAAFDPARREEAYRRIATERVSYAAATFADLSDLVQFLDRAVTEVKQREALAELEMQRLLALHRALANIDMMEKDNEPYASWTKARESQIVYSDPAGQWFVRSDMFWALQEKYKDVPAVADRIAWEGAQIPLPGECEGYLPCHLYALTQSEGRYLKLYPRGGHAGDALRQISDFLSTALGTQGEEERPVFEIAPEDKAELAKNLAELRAQVTPTSHPLRARVLEQLDAVAQRYK